MPTGLPAAEKSEPGFEDLLMANRPLNPPPMPMDRPAKVRVYVDRDSEYYHEVNRLKQAVVVHTMDLPINFELSVDKVAEWVTQTKVMEEKDVTIAAISKKRFLIIMPEGIAPETLIEAIPYEIWDLGLSFQKWDSSEDAVRMVPQFRTIVDILDIPPPLYKEKEVINLVNSFGLYLGSIAQRRQEDISCWTVVVATEKLEDIPYAGAMVAGGQEYPVQFRAVNWARGPIYNEEDFPEAPIKFAKPPKPTQESQSRSEQVVQGHNEEDEEVEDKVYMSRRVLREICRDIDPTLIPEELREVIAGYPMEQSRWSGGEGSNMVAQEATPQAAVEDQQQEMGLDLQPVQNRLKSIICVPQRIYDDSPNSQVQHGIMSHASQLSDDVEFDVVSPKCIGNEEDEKLRVLDETDGDVASMQTSLISPLKLPVTQTGTGGGDISKETVGLGEGQGFSPATSGGVESPQETLHLMTATPIQTLPRKEVQVSEARQSVCNKLKRRRRNPGKNLMRDGPGGPSNETTERPKAALQLGPDGLYQIQVNYSHAMGLAATAGIEKDLLDRVIQEDNQERAKSQNEGLDNAEQHSGEEEGQQEINWGDHSSPETEDEGASEDLSTDEEVEV